MSVEPPAPPWSPLAPGTSAGEVAPLRVAVLGCGRFGALHARKLAALGAPAVRLVAAVDPIVERARLAASGVPGCRAAVDLATALAQPSAPEAAIVAVPIPQLAAVARAALEAGLHVLVEKPGAASTSELRTLARAAAERGLTLAFGYVERFNPAVVSEAALGPGRRLVVRRSGVARPNAGPLALDWLVHDLDLAHRLLGVAPGALAVERVAASAGHTETLRVRLRGPAGEKALLSVRRGAVPSVRRLDVDGRRASLLLTAGAAADPLTEQAVAFARRVRGGSAGPLAEAADALAVLALAETVARLAEAGAALPAAG